MHGTKQRCGATLTLLAIMLPVILILAAFAVNVTYMELNRTELQIATDAAARAAGRRFAMTGDVNLARAEGQAAAAKNEVARQGLTLADSDFVFGTSLRSSLDQRYVFTPSGGQINAVRVTGRRSAGSPDGPIRLLFPNMLGRSTFEPEQQAVSSQIELDVALVIDRSGSMAFAANEKSSGNSTPKAAPRNWDFCDAAPPKSRWLDTVSAVDIFLDELNRTPVAERVSLASYSTTASIDRQLTTDYASIRSGMDVYTKKFCGGSTNVGGGMQQGLNTLKHATLARPWASKVVVVMTDGIHNTGTDPLSVARTAGASGIMVYTVTFSNEADERRMRSVADAGHGKHYHAADGAELRKAFREIANSLPTLLTQ